MTYLLDTNVISQRKAERPNQAVLQFLISLPNEQGFLSVITLMEIRAGIEKLNIGSEKRAGLEVWLEQDVQRGFAGRILPVTAEIANAAGRLYAAEKKYGRTPGIPDLLIAATAKVYGMQIVTMNRVHFEPLGTDIADF